MIIKYFNFIFHNYSNGKPLTEKTFKKNWNIVKEQFKKCNFTICPVLNAHFHAFSKECFDILKKNHIKFYEKEIAPYKGELELWYCQNQSIIFDILLIIVTISSLLFPASNLLNYFLIFQNIDYLIVDNY